MNDLGERVIVYKTRGSVFSSSTCLSTCLNYPVVRITPWSKLPRVTIYSTLQLIFTVEAPMENGGPTNTVSVVLLRDCWIETGPLRCLQDASQCLKFLDGSRRTTVHWAMSTPSTTFLSIQGLLWDDMFSIA